MRYYDIVNDKILFLESMNWIVPFLLGLFASLLIDKLRRFQKNKRNKKFILLYLKESFLPDLEKLELNYKKIKDRIISDSEEAIKIPVFESFNINVFNSIESVEYYEAFKNNYTILNEIITTIDFLSKNLPLQINYEFYDFINQHLKEKSLIGDKNHIKTCPSCIEKRSYYISIIGYRIDEVIELRKKIETLLK